MKTSSILRTTGIVFAFLALCASSVVAGTPRVISGRITLPADGASLRRTNFAKTKVSEVEPERWFKIKAPSATALNVTVTGPFFKPADGRRGRSSALRELTANVDCALFDANDVQIEGSDQEEGSAEFLRRVSLTPGNYFLRVRYRGPVSIRAGSGTAASTQTAVLVLLSAGDDWDVINNASEETTVHEAHHVGLLRLPGQGAVGGQKTWITTHGRASAPGARTDGPGTFFQIAKSLARRDPAAQQYLVDWTTAAAPKSAFDLSAGRWFRKTGEALAERLFGRFTGEDVSLLGHSWGAYVNFELAHAFSGPFGAGPVRRQVALDPALTAEHYSVGTVDLSADAETSFALSTSIFGNELVVQTAHDSFRADVRGTDDPFIEHNVAFLAFQEILDSSTSVSAELRRGVFRGANARWERNPSQRERGYDRKLKANGRTVTLSPPVPADQGYEGAAVFQLRGAKWQALSMTFAEKLE